ncbi:MAG: hypothetical protein H6799_01210 [Candidatus Nomurabacteria bacterium]|nr:MAG: hypothetical protein H6799_01210 [Candidatus Nomurabacteria bacterium]HRV76346.1 hypothetical protein [Candidatus Saccharimonadales bacterium]
MQIDKNRLLKLSIDAFDEDDERIGWRLLAEDLGKDREAAELIEEYMEVNGVSDRWLWFHAGQCWAYLQDSTSQKRAVYCFKKSIEPPYDGDSYWYRKATIEYLGNNISSLRDCLVKLNEVDDVDNLIRIVKLMIHQLEEEGRPNYRKMYESL